MSTLIHERVEAARRGDNPWVIARMKSGWAVMGDVQRPPGYVLLLPDPVVGQLNDLTPKRRAEFLADMTALGDALLETTGADRINYEVLGNSEPALHAHIFSRYSNEPEAYRRGPVWLYPDEVRDAHPFDEAIHGALRSAIAAAIAHRVPPGR